MALILLWIRASIHLMPVKMKTIELKKDIFLIQNFWSPEKCDDYVLKTEKQGYTPATIQTENGPRLVDFVRNNNRVICKDLQLANDLWLALQPYAPKEIGTSVAAGLNELFRFYRYRPGQQFKKHRDQSYIRNSTEASFYTLMIYLNDNFKGGATTFDDVTVYPQKGSALIYHYLEHAGSEVLEGTKYVLRTDIMFKLKN
jgi:prolyl 4-hydroxylase